MTLTQRGADKRMRGACCVVKCDAKADAKTDAKADANATSGLHPPEKSAFRVPYLPVLQKSEVGLVLPRLLSQVAKWSAIRTGTGVRSRHGKCNFCRTVAEKLVFDTCMQEWYNSIIRTEYLSKKKESMDGNP
jgi:hypothetical protein